jgi:hypothetical protein
LDSEEQELIPINGDELDAAKRAVDPGLRKLADEKMQGVLRENLRNGRKATAYKAQQRKDYAGKIKLTEGREVRPYNHAPSEARRAAQKANSKAKRSPEQKQKEDDAIADLQWCKRRREKGIPEAEIQAALVIRIEQRTAKREAARQDADDRAVMEQLPNFGIA